MLGLIVIGICLLWAHDAYQNDRMAQVYVALFIVGFLASGVLF